MGGTDALTHTAFFSNGAVAHEGAVCLWVLQPVLKAPGSWTDCTHDSTDFVSSFFKESLLKKSLSFQQPPQSDCFFLVRNMAISLLMAQNLPQYGVRFSGVCPPRKADLGELPVGFHFFGCKGKL